MIALFLFSMWHGLIAQSEITLPGFDGVLAAFNDLLNSDLISGYIFWSLAIGLVGFAGYTLVRMFRN